MIARTRTTYSSSTRSRSTDITVSGCPQGGLPPALRDGWFCCRFPAVRGQTKRRPVRPYEGPDIADKRRSPGPLPHSVFLPAGRRSGLVREGLRSGPETGHLGCVWHTEAADFTAASRQFADKRSVARSAPVACGRKSFYGPFWACV
ncbi:hypothetical protein CU665_10280 [Pseudomonas syringae pv. actinidifoliorum]|nr:hypothetical protein [Pseudomonas syringae pv. actinidifoliorum]